MKSEQKYDLLSYPLKFVIEKLVKETRSVMTFHLTKPEKSLDIDEERYASFFEKVKPGKFLMVWTPQSQRKKEEVASLDSIPLGISMFDKEKKRFAVTVKKVGPTTSLLFNYQPGDALGIMGPYGNGFSLPDSTKDEKVLLIAGGVGLASLRFLYQHLCLYHPQHKEKTHLLYGVKTKEDLIFKKEFGVNFKNFTIFSEDGSTGLKGLPTDRLPYFLENLKPTRIYSCGPEAMLKRIYKIIDKFKCEKTIKQPFYAEYSVETRFYCGVGICGLCSLRGESSGKLVCRDGPVFSHQQLEFWKGE